MSKDRREFIRKAAGLVGLWSLAPAHAGRCAASKSRVLILGDSISIGYTPFVKELLADTADVVRPEENCQGTTHGIANITKWLGDGGWDVIHFNFGLHDLKRVDPATGKNSDNPEDPYQADVRAYSKNLTAITRQLKATGATLIFATTTPFPGVTRGPYRQSEDVARYNRAALKIMKKERVVINDLHGFALPRLQELQRPNNVHFTDHGSRALAQQVADAIRHVLKV